MAGSPQHHTRLEDAEDQVDHLLGNEYEHEPVPAAARRSLFSITMVWAGFPMIITGAMTGSILVLGMGFMHALLAMLIGNVILLGYIGALGLLGMRRGVNFALLASVVFGKKGYVLASGLLSTLLLGWYAVQTGITGALISSTYEINYILMTVIAGLLYIGITFVGVRGLHYIGMVSIPLFLVLGMWVAADAASTTSWAAIAAYPGNHGVASMSFGVGLTVVLSLFIDAGTVTADFNRWARIAAQFMAGDVQRLPVRQSCRHAGRRRHDRRAGRAERQPVWLRQHVRLHEPHADRLAERTGVRVPVPEPRVGLLALPVQLGHRLVAHRRHAYARRRGRSSGSSALSSPPATSGRSSSSGSACWACWCRRSAPSSWWTST